jgi:hypothetical protein
LKLNRAQAKVFLASNYYMGAEAIGFAKDLGFVVIAPNGKNLEVYQLHASIALGTLSNNTMLNVTVNRPECKIRAPPASSESVISF